jgi:hypothetical protein
MAYDWTRGDLLPTDTKLWIEYPASSLPMTARAYATCIMNDLVKGGMEVPLHTLQGYSTQCAITEIVETAMAKAVEVYRETRWWRRLERLLTGREWP